MVKLLDQYILRRFLGILAGSLLAFVIVFLVVDIVENLDHYIDAKMPRQAVAAYYLYTLPQFISYAIPMATLLATFFSMGMLHKRNEITAMKSSGLSIRRIGASLLLAGALISTGSFFFDDLLVSTGMRKKADMQSQFLTRQYRRKHKVLKQNIFLQHSANETLAIDRFDYRNQQAKGVYLQRYSQGRLVERIDFNVLKWDEERGMWHASNYVYRSFRNPADTSIHTRQGVDTLISLAITPLDLMKMAVTPEEMRYGELRDFVAQLIRNGVDPTRWVVNLHFKVAFACTGFIMVLFGLPLSVGRPRASLAFGAGMSIFVIFGYYVAIMLGKSLGKQGVLEPWASAWLPNIIFLGLGFYLLLRQRS